MALLTKCKNAAVSLAVDFKNDMIVKKEEFQKLVSRTLFAAGVANMALSAFAISEMSGKVTEAITSLYKASIGIVTVLAALLLVIAFIMRMTYGTQKAAQATSWIERIIICYVCVNCIGLLFSVLNEITSGAGYQTGG